MHFVIMGCGRVGATLAHSLILRGHDVAVIDQDPAAFHRLGPDFPGRRIKGIGFDREVMKDAGVPQAFAFAAVSSGDNSNIIAARVARETFGVERVVARIYDPKRAEIFQRLGIPTVATVRWTADQTLHHLLPEGSTPDYFDPSGTLVIGQIHVNPRWIGRRLSEIEQTFEVRVAFVTRLGDALIPTADSVYQEGDELHLVARRGTLPELEQRLDTVQPQE
ncbi:potassium channel family protein [Ornithinimicrobium faecis]|uniref:potassium channel family protein n=1 Tax=Ornithinimicrobium faecis TaxID=2934158 RepID=UPI002117AB1E|nr:TrkA family potassium uptake protein [Ornithinimicrobium sp. HY1745]